MARIINHRRIFYLASAVMVAVALLSIVFWQFRFGIDFVGGSLWEIALPQETQVTSAEVIEVLEPLGIESIVAAPGDDGRTITLRFLEISEATHREALAKLQERFPGLEGLRFETVGPTISETLRQRAWQSILGVLAVIIIYITWAFWHVSRTIASWKYGAVTLVALLHDVIITLGLFAFLGRFAGVEIGSEFVVALLVVMAYSVHDTIVVFDRVRENIRKTESGETFGETVDKSIRQTFVRSINTSLTLMVVLLALWFWGPDTLRWFAMTIFVGTAVGTYSSLFLASPLLVDLAARRRGDNAKNAAR